VAVRQHGDGRQDTPEATQPLEPVKGELAPKAGRGRAHHR
jgi:hypothetical protein